MKALFYTTSSNECKNHVQAWNSFGESTHLTYKAHGIRNDWQMLEAAQDLKPDVVFWIGADQAPGNPRVETFRKVREIAPLVNLCSDAMDKPWHHFLKLYAKRECFDLQVSIDGAIDSPVDLATLTPIDPRPFSGNVVRDIRCGFSGTVGRWNSRSELVNALEWFGGLTVRKREEHDGYDDHVRFLKRCQMLLNISYTGTGHAHHIKGRVLEAGWAGCVLLESKGSPIHKWFPEDCYIIYDGPKEAAAIIAELDDVTIQNTAKRLNEEVQNRFTPNIIYEMIVEKAKLCGYSRVGADPIILHG